MYARRLKQPAYTRRQEANMYVHRQFNLNLSLFVFDAVPARDIRDVKIKYRVEIEGYIIIYIRWGPAWAIWDHDMYL